MTNGKVKPSSIIKHTAAFANNKNIGRICLTGDHSPYHLVKLGPTQHGLLGYLFEQGQQRPAALDNGHFLLADKTRLECLDGCVVLTQPIGQLGELVPLLCGPLENSGFGNTSELSTRKYQQCRHEVVPELRCV